MPEPDPKVVAFRRRQEAAREPVPSRMRRVLAVAAPWLVLLGAAAVWGGLRALGVVG